ncbi:hypothetical protein cyc_03732 [Cyclospora cayetanensis]|uniref:Uncharacterized protein n=1 Tax=Cyclospora cayetanensis TaxID=88456 RepID=A0A1D3D9V2_9EIME|nr:hypothetical protein cyc_03732 [Cyclospora cayetanensis]
MARHSGHSIPQGKEQQHQKPHQHCELHHSSSPSSCPYARKGRRRLTAGTSPPMHHPPVVNPSTPQQQRIQEHLQRQQCDDVADLPEQLMAAAAVEPDWEAEDAATSGYDAAPPAAGGTAALFHSAEEDIASSPALAVSAAVAPFAATSPDEFSPPTAVSAPAVEKHRPRMRHRRARVKGHQKLPLPMQEAAVQQQQRTSIKEGIASPSQQHQQEQPRVLPHWLAPLMEATEEEVIVTGGQSGGGGVGRRWLPPDLTLDAFVVQLVGSGM